MHLSLADDRIKVGIIFHSASHKPQLDEESDAVAKRTVDLDARAQTLGESLGIAFTSFVLPAASGAAPANEAGASGTEPESAEASANDGATMLAATLRTLTSREERVTLERRAGRWGLYFLRGAAALGGERGAEAVPLKDAPLEARERFLLHSEEFFAQYLDLCEDRRTRMRQAVAAADRTLALLDEHVTRS
ncbi:MAG TPA: hypothetical protein VL332_04015 [Candidatus Saccharimonadaceae bacterium]|jgi:hypothetical protein|nr:hypothetical protein [Candidatus Saccharimonadaceae bacterium]